MAFINQYEPRYGKEEIRAMNKYLQSGGWLMEFKETQKLEEEIKKLTGVKYVTIVSNGTAAIFIALKSLDIGPGDEVIVPDLTMAATANAVVLTGAKVVFADIEEKSFCLNAEKVRKAITKKTKAVIHVSFNGRAGELTEIKNICRKNKIYLVEDAAQSLGSFYNRKHLGTFGEIGIFSFSIHKIITTGQGGAVITNSPRLFEKIKRIKDFGRLKGGADIYKEMGWNFKFTDIQSVIGLEQIKKIKKRIIQKRKMLELYRKNLREIKEVKFVLVDQKGYTPWFIEIMVPRRQELMAFLKKEGIGSRPIYPALHTQKAYQKNNQVKISGRYPVASKISRQTLWLPFSFNLKEKDIKYICRKIKEFFTI